MPKKKSREILQFDGCRKYYFVTALSSLFGVCTHAFEASDVLVYTHGPLSLRPQLAVAEQFNDNVYFANSERRADFITSVSPGIKLQIGEDFEDQNHLSVRYTMDKLWYLDNPALDALQQRIRADAYYSQSRFSISGYDLYESLASVLGGAFNVGKQKVRRDVWSDRYRLSYRIGERLGAYVQGQHVETDFQTQLPLFDTRTLSGTAGFQYSYSGRTFLFGESYYGRTSLQSNVPGADRPPGTSFIGGFLGVRGDFTEKIKGTIKAGYEVSTFSGGTVATVDKTAGSSPVVEASLSYNPTDRLTVSLDYSRHQLVSVQFERSSYSLDSVTANLSESMGSARRLRLDASATYNMFSFDPAAAYPLGRTDSNWRFQVGGNFFFQSWLYTRLEYDFERFTSDFASIVDYNVNSITLSVAIGY